MGKSQEILLSGAQRSFWGDVCFQHPHLMYQTHPRTIKGDVVTSGIFLLHVSLCVMLGPQHMRVDWRTASMESLLPVHCGGARTEFQLSGLAARAFTYGALLLAHDYPLS